MEQHHRQNAIAARRDQLTARGAATRLPSDSFDEPTKEKEPATTSSSTNWTKHVLNGLLIVICCAICLVAAALVMLRCVHKSNPSNGKKEFMFASEVVECNNLRMRSLEINP